MDNTRTVSSLDEVKGVLQDMGINAIDQADQVRFCLHEQTSLKISVRIKLKTRPGRHGFRLMNFELLDCKCKARLKIQKYVDTELNASMLECNKELYQLDSRIAHLKGLILFTDTQIPHVAHIGHRVPYQPAYNTTKEINAAVSHDKRAQRACWNAVLRILELKKSIVQKKKFDLLTSLTEEFNKLDNDQSDLGVGYCSY